MLSNGSKETSLKTSSVVLNWAYALVIKQYPKRHSSSHDKLKASPSPGCGSVVGPAKVTFSWPKA